MLFVTLNENPKGFCFKNKLCYGTPKPCIDCKVRCEGFSGGSNSPSTAPTPVLASAPALTPAYAPAPSPASSLTPVFDPALITCKTKDGKNCPFPLIINSEGSSVPAPAPTPAPISVSPRILTTTCTTKDGKKCQFPFIYQGEKYEACPPDPEDPNENWCSTRTDADGEHVGGGGHYGFCGDSCPLV